MAENRFDHRAETQQEAIAKLSFMVQHNEKHSGIYDNLAADFERLDLPETHAVILEAIRVFDEGNRKLAEALDKAERESGR